MISRSAARSRTNDQDAPDPERTVSREDVQTFFAEHPGTVAGIDVTPIIAAQKARRLRPDLSDEDFRVLILQALATTSGHQATIVEEILAYLAAVRPPRPRPGRVGRPRLREQTLRRELLDVLAQFRAEDEDRPTREEISERLGIDPTTLRRRLVRFPRLRELLPISGRPHRA